MKQRDPTLDLYRVLLMFGIVLFHAVNSCGHQDFRLSSNLAACVDAFGSPAARRIAKSKNRSLKILIPMPTLKQKVVKGAIGTLLEQCSVQGAQFVIGAHFARALEMDFFPTLTPHSDEPTS